MDHPVIGLTANTTKPGAAELVRRLATLFRQGGARILCEEDSAELAGEPGGLPLQEVAAEASVLVVLGGDGTILHVARRLAGGIKPLAALNIGRLGFLTTATTSQTEEFVSSILQGHYRISHRRTVEASFTVRDGRELTLTGLNETVVSRGAISRLIRLRVTVDDAFLNCYNGDGLIVSTPTGSTAYSLSAGGPIVNPEAEVFCITPICPHAVSNRSFVVNNDVTVEITPEGNSEEELLLNIDGGAPWQLSREKPVVLRRGAWSVPLVMPPRVSFYDILRQKLQWNGSSV